MMKSCGAVSNADFLLLMSEEIQNLVLSQMARIESKLDSLSQSAAGRMGQLETEVALLKQRLWLYSLAFGALFNLGLEFAQKLLS